MRKRKSSNPNDRFFYVRQMTLGFLDATLVLMALSAIFFIWVYYSATPAASQLVQRKISQTSILYDRTGKNELYELHGEENRKIISHNEIPDNIRLATIATEDDNFYYHIGIDPLAVLRAIKVNLTNNEISQGGSTITQQLARNAFLTRERTLKRKFLEAIFALKIERHYTKDEILDQYLNEVPYGANAYGVEAASETFFGKQAKDLTLDEAAFLAGLPKAPSYFSPYNTHRDALAIRQKYILGRIAQLKLVPQAEVDKALAVDTFAKIQKSSQPIIAPHFVYFVLEQLESKYGKEFLETGGLRIQTSLDLGMQKIAENAVVVGAQKNLVRGATNAALVAVDPKSGDILSMVGSKNFFDTSIDGQVNIATSLQQPGSSFKPFAYAAAFEKGYQPETKILDAPTDFGPDGSGRDYIPRNYDGKFHGLLSMRETLSQSLNIPAIKTLYLAGIDYTIDLAHKMGITTLNDRQKYGLSLVIGGGDVKLLDMASAFSVFANDGVRNPARSVISISDTRGNVVQKDELNPVRVLDQQIARKIDSILSDNKARTPIFGAHSPLIMDDGRPIAAKTGTTQEFRDAWTVGFTPQIAVGVWAGNNDNRPMKDGSDGVFVAAPIWHDFMTQVLAGKPTEQFIAYDGYGQNNPTRLADASFAGNMTQKITYYRNGKQISAEKAAKTDPNKIEKKIEYIPIPGAPQGQVAGAITVAMPAPTDPMYKKWIGQTNDFQNNAGNKKN